MNEWDVATVRKVNTYANAVGPGTETIGLGYIGRSRDFAVAIGRPGSTGGSILRYAQGTTDPTVTVDVPNDVGLRDVGTDPQGATLYVLTEQTARILRLDPTTLSERSPIILNAPIGSSSINGNTVGASLLNGELSIDSTPGKLFMAIWAASGIKRNCAFTTGWS